MILTSEYKSKILQNVCGNEEQLRMNSIIETVPLILPTDAFWGIIGDDDQKNLPYQVLYKENTNQPEIIMHYLIHQQKQGIKPKFSMRKIQTQEPLICSIIIMCYPVQTRKQRITLDFLCK
jgi:hypothetical protein